ncbi:MAG: hypothetical protein H8D72_02480 [Planctomycetes bacterium]|nr:hypothetical protein [Planctomycetota bacterium]
MTITLYQILHVSAGFLLTAFTFMACATASVGKNKGILALTGILSLIMLVGGFGLIARLEYGWPGWVLVKVACWLILTMAAGFAYRRPQKAGAIAALCALAIVVAVAMVYTKPF